MAEVTIATPRGIRLSGTLLEGSSPSGRAVLFAHGFLDDRSSRGRADGLAATYRAAGLTTLAFDFSGCGTSDDDVVTVAHEVQDLQAASTFLAEAGYDRQAVHAHSLGALVALRTRSPHVTGMVLTGAVSGPFDHPWEEILAPSQLAELRRTGRTTVLDDGPTSRERLEISEQTIADLTDIDQATVLGGVGCPVLLMHGGALVDGEEHPLLTRSRVGLPMLPPGSRLEVLNGGDHALLDRTEEVGARAVAWLTELGLP